MNFPAIRSFARPSGSCEVRMTCGDITTRDRVLTVEFYGSDMTIGETHALITKTLACAQKSAADVHGGDTITVGIRKNGDPK